MTAQIKQNTTQINIAKGEQFYIGVRSYSDITKFLVTALKDIKHEDFEEMYAFSELVNERYPIDGHYRFDYDFIAPYLYLKGFITEPLFLKTINFYYEVDINQADEDLADYDKKEFLKEVANLRGILSYFEKKNL